LEFGIWNLEFVACLVVLLALVGSAHALSVADIRSRARNANAELDRLRQSQSLDATAEKRLIEELGRLALAFLEQSDEVIQSGSERKARETLLPTFEAIHRPLDAIYRGRGDWMEGEAKAIMDADGDLEALYETAKFQESQSIAAQALYYLNWLNLYGGRLSEGSRRRELLEAAERGFSEFAVGDQKSELVVESLLGRGLCHMELGNFEWAVRDFRLVLDQPNVSPQRKEKTRLALLESYARSGSIDNTLRYSDILLSGAELAPGDVSVVRYFRLQALFDAAKKTPAKADRYRQEASALMETLRRAGAGWADKVDALMATQIDDPAKWVGKANTPRVKWELARMLLQKGDEGTAVPLLEEIVADGTKATEEFRPEASYWLGVARFKAGDYSAAAKHLEAALVDADATFAAEARYLRFKALESMMAGEPTAELEERYRNALNDLLGKNPDYKLAYEARYRLAELLQANGEFEKAIDEYAKVKGDPELELRAQFGSLQCEFEQIRNLPNPAARSEHLTKIGEHLQVFWKQARALEKSKKSAGSLPEVTAKATLLQAVYLSMQEEDHSAEVAELLADFDQRFPQQEDLLSQALRLRLVALRETGEVAEAERIVKSHAEVLSADPNQEALERLAVSFSKAGAKYKGIGDSEKARQADGVALALYGIIREPEGAAGDRRSLTIAQLYESTGDSDRAASTYEEILQESPKSLASLHGLARIAEKKNDTKTALDYWKRYTDAAQPGDAPWYRGHYQQARLTFAHGDAKHSCEMLTELRPAMPGLGDAELRRQLNELYDQVCG
jgi:tetratricopeptide (TPR) repeat protein